jgi:flagellar FliJ protein
MAWTDSLIKISNYEVETLQKRLAEIVDRRTGHEIRLAMITAEGEAEIANAQHDAQAGWYLVAEAFEALKKYEQVHENRAIAAAKEMGRRETAELDELGLRRASAR